MGTLAHHANNVLGEFGNVIPEEWLSFEDVARQFVRVRALELQKLGIGQGNKTLVSEVLSVTAREGAMPTHLVPSDNTLSLIPAWVEIVRSEEPNIRVEIIPADMIPDFNDGYAIAFYGTPMKYRMSSDLWDLGSITLWYDPVEDWDSVALSDTTVFPPQFHIMLEIRTALALVPLIPLKIASLYIGDETNEKAKRISSALEIFGNGKRMELADWESQMRLWRNRDGNESPRLRRGYDEILSRSQRNSTRW